MFKLSQSQSYLWPVSVELPADGGKVEKSTFDAEFKRLSQSRIAEIMELAKKEELSDRALCVEILVGWKGVLDESGEPLPFSESSRDQLLDIQLVSTSILKAFFESLQGAKRKNS